MEKTGKVGKVTLSEQNPDRGGVGGDGVGAGPGAGDGVGGGEYGGVG